MKKTITIDKANYEYLTKYIDKLNRKAEKLNANKIAILEEKEIFTKENESDISYVSEIEITLSYDLISIGEYKVLANLNHTYDNGNIISMIDKEYEIPKEYYTIEGKCDHCNINHMRKVTYLIEDENKNIKQIGKACLKEYTGYNIERVLRLVEYIDNIEEYFEDMTSIDGDRYQKYFSVTDILNISKIVIDKYGYISKTKKEDIYENQGRIVDSTSDIIKNVLAQKDKSDDYSDIYRDIVDMRKSEKIFDEVKSAIEWISNKRLEDITSSYINNLKILASNEYVGFRDIGYLGSLLVAYKKDMEYIEKKNNENKQKKISEYVGNIGDKLKSSVKCKKIIPIETMFGSSRMYMFEDMDGNTLVWMTSKYDFECSEDSILDITYTVKDHSEYKGTKQTKILRVKRV